VYAVIDRCMFSEAHSLADMKVLMRKREHAYMDFCLKYINKCPKSNDDTD